MKENTQKDVQQITKCIYQKTPEKSVSTAISYIEPKLYNMIAKDIKEAKTTDDFKTKLKEWIWKNIHYFHLFNRGVARGGGGLEPPRI